MARGWAALLAVVVLTTSEVGVAQPEPEPARPRVAALSWVRMPGAESCITPRALAQRVEARLGRPVFVPPAQAELVVEGHVERLANRWHVLVRMVDGEGAVLGTRELDEPATECGALDEPLGLVVSVMIDPDAVLAPVPPAAPVVQPAPPEPVAPEPVAPQLDAPPPVCVEPPARSWGLGIAAGGVGTIGLLPDYGIGGNLRITVTPPGLIPIVAQASVFVARDASLQAGGGAELQLVHGELDLCPVEIRRGALGVLGCGGVLVGTVQSRGFGFDTEHDDEGLVAAATLQVIAGVRLAGAFGLSLGAGVAVVFVRQRFFATAASGDEREVFAMPPVAGLLTLSVDVDFGS